MQKRQTSTRREKVEQREDAIIDAARRTFLAKGFARTTMAEIARLSGVADGTVYLYFKNKDDLARTVVSDFYRRLTESAQSGVDELSTVEAQLSFLGSHHMERVMDERRILEMSPLIGNNIDSYGGSELFGLNKNYVLIFDRIVKKGQSSGVIKASEMPWILRDIFFGSMDYGLKTMAMKNRREDIKLFIDSLLNLILVNKSQTLSEVNAQAQMRSLAERFEAAATRLEKSIE